MSKKDLLERLSRAPVDSRSRREEETPGRASGGESVTTRVSRKVVRRRQERRPAGTTVTRRRAAVVSEETPKPQEAEAERPQVVAEERAEPAPEAEAPPAEKPLPPEVLAAQEAREQAAQEAEVQPAEPTPAPAREAAAEPEEAPVAAQAPAAEPEAQPEAPPAAPAAPEPEPEPAPAAGAAAPKEQPKPADDASKLPEAPRYAGLGKAVVMPPPGYDPTNPMAYRREQQAQQQQQQDARATRQARGRRRVEPGAAPAAADTRGRGAPSDSRGRRGRRGRTPFDRPMRAPKRRRSSGPKAASPAPKAQKRKVRIDNVVSVGQLAHELGVKASVVIKTLMEMGQMATITEMLDMDTAALVAAEFDYEVENVGFQEVNYIPQVEDEQEEEYLQARPAVVTIMGHVDHGKTTLLDAIRSARVAAGEAGGITQHIGAYQVEKNDQLITFIDTPGHEAFTAMRARGADVTDLVILVVAADDGVQPQTEEAISHAKAAGVPILVAINKMDKAGVNPDVIKQRLADYDLLPEEWGGETLFVPVSALRQTGIDDLLDAVLLQSELLDLKANPDRHAEGQVIEAKMERGRGAVATVLVQKGTLNRGDYVVLGSAYGKVRAMLDHRGKRMKKAGPSTPVELFGLSELPEVGDAMVVVKTEKNARKLAEHRADAKREALMAQSRRRTAEDLYAQASEQERETLLLILKADVQGSLEALRSSLDSIKVEGAEVRLLHSAVGDISESDVNLASANGAMLIGFNVNVDAKAREAAQQQGVEPEMYSVIYDVLDRVERDMKGLLAPVYELVRQGSAEVRLLFRISRVGTVAGSYVLDGKIGRNHHAKVLRDGEVVWEGKIDTLRRFKDDVKEVSSGYECGISLAGYDQLREGDVIESYAEEVVSRD